MNKYRAETTISLLIAIVIFSILILVFSHWQSAQNKRLNLYFQKQQAVQILESQIALKLAGLACENHIIQNQVRYEIYCSATQFSIRFPLGEIELNND